MTGFVYGHLFLVLQWVLLNSFAENDSVRGKFSTSPWLSIAENVLPDLVSSFENLRNEMDSHKFEVKPTLVARFGKILFHGLVFIIYFRLVSYLLH